jgi:GrpB-like predicted nucleotidyltransferase (UPF0157 family)
VLEKLHRLDGLTAVHRFAAPLAAARLRRDRQTGLMANGMEAMRQQPENDAHLPSDAELVSFAREEHFREDVARLFEKVQSQVRALVPTADVQHVGSTAIPGSLTKGDLDVQVRVSESDYSAAKERLSKMYDVNVGGFAAADAMSFEDYSSRPTLGIHLTVIGGSADIQWIFRDLLAASPVLRERYDQLKRQFEGRSMEEYRSAKAEFVSHVLHSRDEAGL